MQFKRFVITKQKDRVWSVQQEDLPNDRQCFKTRKLALQWVSRGCRLIDLESTNWSGWYTIEVNHFGSIPCKVSHRIYTEILPANWTPSEWDRYVFQAVYA